MTTRYYSLDFWRGVACLLVVAHHAALYGDYWMGGADAPRSWASPLVAATARMWVGVPIFFVISGYCIAAASDPARQKGGVGRYFLRRFRRIYPPYWAALLLLAVAALAFRLAGGPGPFTSEPFPVPMPWRLDGWQWLGNLTLTETWRPHAVGTQGNFFLGPAWTLCYEEQFYAVMGLLLLLARRRFFLGVAAVTLACWSVQAVAHFHNLSVSGFFFDGYWTPFAAGVLVYWWRIHAGKAGRVLAPAALLLGSLVYACSFYRGLGVHSHPDQAAAVGLPFALLLCLLSRWDGALHASRVASPLTWCGTMCYSLYLLHFPACKALGYALYCAGARGDAMVILVTLPACLAASVLAGRLFYAAVERHFLPPPKPR